LDKGGKEIRRDVDLQQEGGEDERFGGWMGRKPTRGCQIDVEIREFRKNGLYSKAKRDSPMREMRKLNISGG